MAKRFPGDICDFQWIQVGQVTDRVNQTGVTVVLFQDGALTGVDVRGGAPGSHETELLRADKSNDAAHAVVLAGGSAFGLEAASGVMRALEERGIGFPTPFGPVPIVPAAILFDLGVGNSKVRPTALDGYQAVQNAAPSLQQGRYGAGTGATCGKIVPGARPHRGGIGSATVRLPSGAMVSALIAVNACGDIYDPRDGTLVAAGELEGKPVRALNALLATAANEPAAGCNTTIGIVATNAKLNKAQVNRLASVAHDGLALAIRPVHTDMDGDTLFAACKAEVEESFFILQAAAVEAVWRAVVNAVTADD